MRNTIAKWRNAIMRFLYVYVLKEIFFLIDPEWVHEQMVLVGRLLGTTRITRALTALFFSYTDPILRTEVLGMKLNNPIGLSAGFDKNAHLTAILPSVGFGFEEVGSITGHACAGNPRPRMWRLKKSKSLLIHYGLNNDGCEVIAKRLLTAPPFRFGIGTSIAMTNRPENLDEATAIEDYAKAFAEFANIGDYTTVNISCPNAQGGQPFNDPGRFDRLFNKLDTISTNKPIFIKFSPDMPREQVDKLLEVAKKHRIHGIVCTNLTKNRDNPAIHDSGFPAVGGLSGKPVQQLSDELLKYIYKKEGERFVLVGVGGVFTAEDAYRKIRLGASLIQMITGMIYEGPQVVSEINRGLAELLRRDGFNTIEEARGVDAVTVK